MSRDLDRHARQAASMLGAGQALIVERTHIGTLRIFPFGLRPVTERMALEGINPFKQDEHELRFQLRKAGYAA